MSYLIFTYVANSFVLLTANTEDLRKLAKKLMTGAFVEKIAGFISRAVKESSETDMEWTLDDIITSIEDTDYKPNKPDAYQATIKTKKPKTLDVEDSSGEVQTPYYQKQRKRTTEREIRHKKIKSLVHESINKFQTTPREQSSTPHKRQKQTKKKERRPVHQAKETWTTRPSTHRIFHRSTILEEDFEPETPKSSNEFVETTPTTPAKRFKIKSKDTIRPKHEPRDNEEQDEDQTVSTKSSDEVQESASRGAKEAAERQTERAKKAKVKIEDFSAEAFALDNDVMNVKDDPINANLTLPKASLRMRPKNNKEDLVYVKEEPLGFK